MSTDPMHRDERSPDPTGPDPYEFFDAAYLIGALSEYERLAFQAHLEGCAACRARVEVARDVVPYLRASQESDLDTSLPPLPETLLPGLLAQARRTNRRMRAASFALGAAAAAGAAVALTLPQPSTPPGQTMVAVRPSAVTATASLRATPWGTEITVHCGYAHGAAIPAGYRYALSVRSSTGVTSQLGSWQLNDGRSITYSAGTALPIGQIRAVDITDSDGTALLELTGPSASSGG